MNKNHKIKRVSQTGQVIMIILNIIIIGTITPNIIAAAMAPTPSIELKIRQAGIKTIAPIIMPTNMQPALEFRLLADIFGPFYVRYPYATYELHIV